MNFPSPITIAPNTPYIVSYLAPQGYYADDQYYSWSTLTAAPLHVPGSSPGVYAYGSSVLFPSDAWNSSNYWVDLVFIPSETAIQPATYSISGQVSNSAATLTLSGTASGSTTTDKAGNYSLSGLPNGSYVVVPSQSGYTFTPSSALLSIKGASIAGVNFSAATAVPHSVYLSWISSTSSAISGYTVYRATVPGGPYAKLTIQPVAATSSLITMSPPVRYISTLRPQWTTTTMRACIQRKPQR